MEIVRGTATFPGIALGKVRFYEMERDVSRNLDMGTELQRLQSARNQLTANLYEKWMDSSEEEKIRLKRDWELLESDSFLKAIRDMIESQKVRASYALALTRDEMQQTYGEMTTLFIQQRMQSVNRICTNLMEILEQMVRQDTMLNEPAIVVSRALSPADMIGLRNSNLLALITEVGAGDAHTAILAKSLEIPMIVDIEVREEWNGRYVIVDGYTGVMYIDPSQEVLLEYEIRRRAELQEKEDLLSYKDKEDRTKSGKKVEIFANIGSLSDADSVNYYGAAGIGLMRTEIQYLEKDNYPTEEELYQTYKKLAEKMGQKPVIIRTVDLGADKKSDYMMIPDETNPVLGNRGIRYSLDHKEILFQQLRAIYRAGIEGELGILYPMVTSVSEVEEIQKVEEDVKASLREEHIPFCENMRTGIMIETPAAVMISGDLAKMVNFLSLGTNDLTQYTLAMDRQNLLLKNKYDDHHPAIFRMVEYVVREAHQNHCKVMICGELAADTQLTEYFVKLGMDALSVVPACVLPVRKALRDIE